MSIQLMARVWRHKFDHATQSIVQAMADHADDEGNHIYPSLALIAWKTDYSIRQVRRIVGQLQADKVLILVHEARQHRAREYRLDLSGVPLKPPFRADTMTGLEKPGRTLGTARADISGARADIAMSAESSIETSNIESPKEIGAPDAAPPAGKGGRRQRKGPDPRTKSDEIQTYHRITGRYPHLTLYDLVINAAKGRAEADLLPYYQAWVLRGHNPNAATWLVEWAVAGSIPTNGGHRNGASKQATRGDGSGSPAGQGGESGGIKSPARIIAERLSRGESVG